VGGLIVAFLGTNIDGFLCLAAAFAVDPPPSRFRAVFAAACAFVLLLLVAVAASLAIDRLRMSAAWFGVVPATIGVVRLLRALRGAGAGSGAEDPLSSAPSIFAIVLATGTDNVAVYAPLLATRSLPAAAGVAGVFLALWVSGCAAVAIATPNLPRIHALKRYLDPALAIFFIAIGIVIAFQGRFLL
jgi:cadmium resistance protein CadD (predicted permease)